MHNHYYQQELPEDVLELLTADDDPMIAQQEYPDDGFVQDKGLIKSILNQYCIYGKIVVFVYEGKVAIVIQRVTAWLGKFDTKVSKEASARDVVKAYKAFVEWAKENTGYKKLESRTPLEKFAKVMAKAGGGEIEGIMKNSFMTKEHNMVNEYIVGVVLCQ